MSAKKATPGDETALLGKSRPADVPAASASQEVDAIDPPAPDVFEGLLAPGQVPVVDDIGRKTHIPEADYSEALKAGYRFQTDKEQDEYARHLKYGGLGQQIKTGAEGFAKGLTLGLSTPLETGLGISSAADIKGREEENPLLFGVSEVAGAIAPEFIPGVGEVMLPKLATQAGRLASKSLVGEGTTALGRVGYKTLAGAFEGSLFGVGNTISEASLGEPELNAEKIVANVGLGSIMGAGGGALGGLFEEAAGPALRKMASSMNDVEGALHGVSNEMTMKAAGFIQSDLNKLTATERREVAAMLRERGHLAGTATETLETVQKDLGETAKRVGAEIGVPEVAAGKIHPGLRGGKDGEGVEAVGEALNNHGPVVGAILKDADAAGATVNFNRARATLRNAAIDDLNPIERDLAEPFLKKTLKGMDALEAEGKGFEGLNSIKSTLQGEINYKADSNSLLKVKKKLVGILTDEIDTQLAPQIGSDLSKKFLDSKRTYGLLKTAEEALEKNGSRGTDAIAAMAERAGLDTADTKALNLLRLAENGGLKGATRASGNRYFSLGDRLKGMVGAGIGSTIGGPVGAMVGMKAGELAERFARTRGPAFVALATDWITKTPAMLAIAQHFGHSASRVVGNLGEFGPIMSSALASGPAAALATHIMLSREQPAYRERAALAGMPEQTQEEQGRSLERAHHLEAVKETLKAQDHETDLHIGHVLRGEKPPKMGASSSTQDFGAKRMRQESVAGHERQVEDVMAMASDPGALADRIATNTAGLGEHAPATVAAMSAVAYRAASFLASKAAKPPKGGPLAQKWHPSSGEVATFGRYMEATQNPASALRHAAAGTLTPEHVEALRSVYPAYLAHLQASILDRLTDNPKSVPYRARVSLALLGVDPDGSFSAGSIQAAQAVFSGPSSRDSAQQASTGPKPGNLKGADRLTVAARSQTRSQATEAREG